MVELTGAVARQFSFIEECRAGASPAAGLDPLVSSCYGPLFNSSLRMSREVGETSPMRIFAFLLFFSVGFFALPHTGAQELNLLQALLGGKADSSEKKSTQSSRPRPGKRVEINLTEQKLRAYEGNRLVMKTRISSGRNNRTPTGSYRAGPYKAENHYSSLYHNAHMPWSVQVSGHIFIHGFAEVPNYPASSGCIRVPISGRNPAKRLYKWLDVGTPVRISY